MDVLSVLHKVMTLKILTLVASICVLGTTIGQADQIVEDQELPFPDWSFCIVYQFRDADERDARPLPIGEDGKPIRLDPFGPEDSWIPNQILRGPNIVDFAALSTRTLASKTLSHVEGKRVISSTIGSDADHPMMDCYDPHHIFVFYNNEGLPISAIEVCFRCSRVKLSPNIIAIYGRHSSVDFPTLAKIVIDSGLAIPPYENLEDYLKELYVRLGRRMQ